MAFKVNEVPEEVVYVWRIQMVCEMTKRGIGSEKWKKCQRIINKYPEWFPADPKEELPVSEARLAEIQSGK